MSTATAGTPVENTTPRAGRREWLGLAVLMLPVLLVSVDGTVLTFAVPSITRALVPSGTELLWAVDVYPLVLAGLLITAGTLGDRFGRRRVFVVGTVAFALASAACGLAPSPEVLIVARLLQGVGGALLVPGSLAMIQGAFAPADRARAIGSWSGLGAIAGAIGPFVGGVLVDYASWRWIFLVNLPLALVTVVVARRWVPESADPRASRHLDVLGALLATLALGGTTYALVEAGGPVAPWAGGLAVLAAVAFVVVERREREPMLDLGVFADRTFSAANVLTLLMYAALGSVLFFVTLQLQTVGGYSALAAGVSTLPMTLCMLLLASRGGALAARIGPRIPLTVGPLVLATGVLLLLRVGPDVSYAADVLPGITVFGLGLSLTVAPLTATVLAAAPDEHAGIASGVNNAVARTGQLLAVAALPVLVGLGGAEYADPVALDAGYHRALLVAAALMVGASLVAALFVRSEVLERGPAG